MIKIYCDSCFGHGYLDKDPCHDCQGEGYTTSSMVFQTNDLTIVTPKGKTYKQVECLCILTMGCQKHGHSNLTDYATFVDGVEASARVIDAEIATLAGAGNISWLTQLAREIRALTSQKKEAEQSTDYTPACTHPDETQKWFNMHHTHATRWCGKCGALNRGDGWTLPKRSDGT